MRNLRQTRLAWQPIETAPKDRWILGFREGIEFQNEYAAPFVIVRWSTTDNEWRDEDFYPHNIAFWCYVPLPAKRKRSCKVEGCKLPHRGKGYCKLHLRRFNDYGDATFSKAENNKKVFDSRQSSA